MNNKAIGNSFEQDLCNLFSEKGFWAHNFANKTGGQPADVIAARNKQSYLIDAKVCSDDKFKFSRIEENQKNSMFLWNQCGNGIGYFALKLSDDSIWMLSSEIAFELRKETSVLSLSEIKIFAIPFDKWLEGCV